ncbi:hypothetical protein [Mycolicibacterium sp.]|uniref:beta family protein n=1 Tax=Mycolicibacterium sp. TaxID=2320850 RepID=UPI0037C7C3E3
MVQVNAALGKKTYVAVLKAKQGELLAVQTTPPESFVPLLEVPESAKVPAVLRSWQHEEDALWVHPLNVIGFDEDVWAQDVRLTFQGLRDANVAAVPVVTTHEDSSLLAIVRSVVTQDGRGLVIRLDCEDALEAGPQGLTADFNDVFTACGVAAQNCDVVIDAGLVEGGLAVQSSVVSTVLATLPHLNDWRNVVVAFSAFPAAVGDLVPRNTVGSIPRADAAAFAHLTSGWQGRELAYADYAVGVPTYADLPFSPIPNIRYAIAGGWKVHRANERRNPNPQYIGLARDVAAAAYFGGPTFSAGDAYIASVASGSGGPGNASSYLRAAMSRHFHVVLDSLATRGVP